MNTISKEAKKKHKFLLRYINVILEKDYKYLRDKIQFSLVDETPAKRNKRFNEGQIIKK